MVDSDVSTFILRAKERRLCAKFDRYLKNFAYKQTDGPMVVYKVFLKSPKKY